MVKLDIPMPEACSECPCCFEEKDLTPDDCDFVYTTWCGALGKEIRGGMFSRLAKCPLEPVNDPKLVPENGLCPYCHRYVPMFTDVGEQTQFCGHCGEAVKWE